MQKLTIDIDDALLEAARTYASQHHTTLTQLIQMQLAQLVGEKSEEQIESSVSQREALRILDNNELPSFPSEKEEPIFNPSTTEQVEEKIAEMFSQLLRK